MQLLLLPPRHPKAMPKELQAGSRLWESPGTPGRPVSSPWGCSPDWEVDHVIDLVPPDKAAEGEALELDDENVGQAP